MLWRGEEIAVINSLYHSLKVKSANIQIIIAPNILFASLDFNPFIANDSLNNNSQEPDVSFLHDNISPLDTDYISPSEFNENFKNFWENSFSVLHLNIRSLHKNFESFVKLVKVSIHHYLFFRNVV